jgi:hypothetical protein
LLGAKVIEIIDKLAGCFETGDGKWTNKNR